MGRGGDGKWIFFVQSNAPPPKKYTREEKNSKEWFSELIKHPPTPCPERKLKVKSLSPNFNVQGEKKKPFL